MTNLFGLPRAQLVNFFANLEEKPKRAKQVMQYLYHKKCLSFEQMTGLPRTLIAKLSTIAELRLPSVDKINYANDGTIKWVLAVDSNNHIEMVYIPQNNRGTLCVSSQVGCALKCSFCATGSQGFNRNLTAAEIISQVMLAKLEVGYISNVVFMGMGEPLLNEKAVQAACDLLLDDLAFGLSWHKVTISTAGIAPAIKRFTNNINLSLAVSLHTVNNSLRDELMPINKKYPLQTLLDACNYYLNINTKKRHILFEYVMLDGINDTIVDAEALVLALRRFSYKNIKINLIPFNIFIGTNYRSSTTKNIDKFFNILYHQGFRVTIRQTRGEDIIAACGQLVGKVNNKTKHYALI